MIIIRNINAGDLNSLVAIEQQKDFSWSEQMLRDCINAGYEFQVIEQSGKIIGYGILSIAADEAEILNIAIDKDFRRQGHGQALLKKLLEIASQRGAQKIFLEVHASNYAALKLYQQLDFQVINIRKNYYRNHEIFEDAIVMVFNFA